jgi:hypothetical protein
MSHDSWTTLEHKTPESNKSDFLYDAASRFDTSVEEFIGRAIQANREMRVS